MQRTLNGADASGAKSIRRQLLSGESTVRKPKYVTLEESRLGRKKDLKTASEPICRLRVARLRRSFHTSDGALGLSVPKSWVDPYGRP
jgi:hypothetical protein